MRWTHNDSTERTNRTKHLAKKIDFLANGNIVSVPKCFSVLANQRKVCLPRPQRRRRLLHHGLQRLQRSDHRKDSAFRELQHHDFPATGKNSASSFLWKNACPAALRGRHNWFQLRNSPNIEVYHRQAAENDRNLSFPIMTTTCLTFHQGEVYYTQTTSRRLPKQLLL